MSLISQHNIEYLNEILLKTKCVSNSISQWLFKNYHDDKCFLQDIWYMYSSILFPGSFVIYNSHDIDSLMSFFNVIYIEFTRDFHKDRAEKEFISFIWGIYLTEDKDYSLKDIYTLTLHYINEDYNDNKVYFSEYFSELSWNTDERISLMIERLCLIIEQNINFLK